MKKYIVFVVMAIIVFNLLGCIQSYMKSAFESMGITEEELQELGLGEFFGIQKVKKVKVAKEQRIEAPKFVGLDILLVNYSRRAYPGLPDAMDILIGNNYMGGYAGNVTFTAVFPDTFVIRDVLSRVESSKIDKGKNYVKIPYDKILPGDGDVITIFFDVPNRSLTGSVRKYYPISLHLDFYYSIIYSVTIPATSAEYYRQAVLSGMPSPTVKRTDGEIELDIDASRFGNILKIPDDYFYGGSFGVGIPITIKNVGGGIVNGNVTLYFIGVSKPGYISITGEEITGIWKCYNLNKEEDVAALDNNINTLRNVGLDSAADLLYSAKNSKYSICEANITGNERKVILRISISPKETLMNQVFEIPLYFIAVYNYEISRNVYILTEKI